MGKFLVNFWRNIEKDLPTDYPDGFKDNSEFSGLPKQKDRNGTLRDRDDCGKDRLPVVMVVVDIEGLVLNLRS